MAKRKKPRYLQMKYQEFIKLPDDEATEIWEEYVQYLKDKGQYNENADKDFGSLMDKVCQSKSSK